MIKSGSEGVEIGLLFFNEWIRLFVVFGRRNKRGNLVRGIAENTNKRNVKRAQIGGFEKIAIFLRNSGEIRNTNLKMIEHVFIFAAGAGDTTDNDN